MQTQNRRTTEKNDEDATTTQRRAWRTPTLIAHPIDTVTTASLTGSTNDGGFLS